MINLFKKTASKKATATIQKMDKNQLSKIIGGGDPTSPDPEVEAHKGGKINGSVIVKSGSDL